MTTKHPTTFEFPDDGDHTTVAPEVLVTIARLAALGVDGVAYMASPPAGNIQGWLQRKVGDGVVLEVRDDTIEVDLYLVVKNRHNVVKVSRAVQTEVARAMEEMVGLNVAFVNIHIEDIDYQNEKRSA